MVPIFLIAVAAVTALSFSSGVRIGFAGAIAGFSDWLARKMGFAVSAATTASTDIGLAVAELGAALGIAERGRPDFLAVHSSLAWDVIGLRDSAKRVLAGRHLHGGTSCWGVMGNGGARIADRAGLGAFAIWDAEGDFGVGSAPLAGNPRAGAAAATRAALAMAGRIGEAPELIWLTVAPGSEEQVLAGIVDVIGPGPRIMGGSSADDDASGRWRQYDLESVHGDGVVVSVLFTSRPISLSYQNGYAPVGPSAVATAVDGRLLKSLDGWPAADVYAEWVQSSLGETLPSAASGSVSILARSTLMPLGRRVGDINGVDSFALAHPAERHAEGSLTLFADIAVGEQLWLMSGSAATLVARAGRVAAQAAGNRLDRDAPVAGALVIFCGGCMLAISDRMDSVASEVETALGGKPFLGIFTFGEQGLFSNGRVEHANLMISCALFEG
jgi:hypothetical protein